MQGANPEPRLASPEAVPKFIPFSDGLDHFGNATRSQGLVIDPGLLASSADDHAPTLVQSTFSPSVARSVLASPPPPSPWSSGSPRPDPTLRTELQLPGTNSSAGDGGHYLHHRAQTAPSLVSARPPSQGSMGSSVARLLGSPAPDGVAIYEYPGSRYREPPSGAGQDPGYRSPPAAAEESEPFNAGAFFLVHEETGPVYLDGYYAAGGGARSPLGPHGLPDPSCAARGQSPKKPSSDSMSRPAQQASRAKTAMKGFENAAGPRVKAADLLKDRGKSRSPASPAAAPPSGYRVTPSSTTSSPVPPSTTPIQDSGISPGPPSWPDKVGEEDKPLPRHLNQLLQQLLGDLDPTGVKSGLHRAEPQAQAPTGRPGSAPRVLSPSSPTVAAPTGASNKRSRLRRRRSEDSESERERERDSNRPRSKKARKLSNGSSELLQQTVGASSAVTVAAIAAAIQLACPFWKESPGKHGPSCYSQVFESIGDITQHLARSHTPEFYCERCFAVFRAEGSHQDHILAASCVRLPFSRLDGVSHAQDLALRRGGVFLQPGRPHTEEAQWFAVWDTVFPRQQKPPSPFIDQVLSERFARFRHHWQHRGRETVVKALRDGNRLSEYGEESTLQRVLNAGFEVIHNDWLTSSRRGPVLASSSPPPRGLSIASSVRDDSVEAAADDRSRTLS